MERDPQCHRFVARTYFNFDMNTATNQPGKPKIGDMTFWQLRDELRDLERRIGPATGSCPDF